MIIIDERHRIPTHIYRLAVTMTTPKNDRVAQHHSPEFDRMPLGAMPDGSDRYRTPSDLAWSIADEIRDLVKDRIRDHAEGVDNPSEQIFERLVKEIATALDPVSTADSRSQVERMAERLSYVDQDVIEDLELPNHGPKIRRYADDQHRFSRLEFLGLLEVSYPFTGEHERAMHIVLTPLGDAVKRHRTRLSSTAEVR